MRGTLLSTCFLSNVLLLLFILSGSLKAQNLDQIGQKEEAFKVSGGVNINQIFYTIDGQESRRDPYTYYFSGNLNFNIYGWSVPFSYSFSNQNSSFRQPFNQYSLHPRYKWVTGHLGYTSMSFSKYTLNGHLFLGVGFDLEPTEKLKVSVMYGRLQKPVEPDSTNESVLPAFKRMGYGIKATYGSNTDNVGVTIFRAKDDINSLSYVPEEVEVLPEENLVVSLSGSKALFESLLIKAEYATSAITRDLRSAEVDDGNEMLGKAGPLFTPRTSSSYYDAFNSSLTYQANNYSVGLGYERVQPGYRTLGAYYFNNDLENITVNAASSIFQNKVNVSANIGIQRDNLDGKKVSSMSRFSNAFNVTYAPSQKLNLGASYSNFKSFTNIRSQFVEINQLTPYDNLDTLNYKQISQNASLNANYTFGASEAVKNALNINLTYQQSTDEQGGVEQNTGSEFYNINTAYTRSIMPIKMSFSVAFNYNENSAVDMNNRTLGPTVAISKALFKKKMRASMSSSWNKSYTNDQLVNEVINLRASASYNVKKKHAFTLSLIGVNNKKYSESGGTDFTEFTGTLGYNYNFSM